MSAKELNSFVHKFHQLWNAGYSAHLNLDTHAGRAWVGLRVQLGHAPGHVHHHLHHPFPQPHKKPDSPSRQRRRARRAAASHTKAEEAANKETADQAGSKPENIIEEIVNDNDETLIDTAEEANIKISDEVCNDEEYGIEPVSEQKSICSVDLYPIKYTLDGLENFRARIEEYFKNRKDTIERVISCEVVDYGNNVKLVTEVKVKRGWIFFFCDPERNYGDLEGIRTVRHSCQDLSNCDKG